MFTLRHVLYRSGLALTAGVLAFNLSVAHAAFTTDISISGDTAFDDGFSIGSSGDFRKVSGGVADVSTYATDASFTGDNPQAGDLFDLGDGFGFTGDASVIDDEFAVGFDTYINVTNLSLNVYDVTFKLDYRNSVNADGDDAYADSELTLFDGTGEIFFSDLISDTVNEDQVGGDYTGGFGDALSDIGSEFFTFTLNSGGMIDLDMSWTMVGGDWESGLAEGSLSAYLSVYAVERLGEPTPVPAPSVFSLLALGLILLPLQRRLRAFMG